MIPHAVISSDTHRVVNIAVWDRATEWHPGEGFFVVRLDDQVIQPSIGWWWNQHMRVFSPPPELVADGGKLFLADGTTYEPPVERRAEPTVQGEMVDPKKILTEIPHKDINWKLADRGQQSDLIFKPGAEVEEIYSERMKLDAFQYVTPKVDANG